MPPSTGITAPAIYPASSDARKLTAPATSSAVPIRLAGMNSSAPFCTRSSIARVLSVSIRPGATTLAVTPALDISREIDRAMPISPALEAA